MRDKWPVREEDIDDFFRTELVDAKDESFLHGSSWDKIVEQLDIIGQLPTSTLPGIENISSVASTAASNSSSFLSGTILSVKGLVISSAFIGTTSIFSYIYLSETNSSSPNNLNSKSEVLIVDSISNNIPIETVEDSKVNEVEQQRNNLTNEPNVTVIDSNKIEKINQPLSTIDKNTVDNKTEIGVGKQTSESEQLNQGTEIGKETVVTNESETKPETNTTQVEDKVNDFREKQLEKARKKARPIFTPEKEK